MLKQSFGKTLISALPSRSSPSTVKNVAGKTRKVQTKSSPLTSRFKTSMRTSGRINGLQWSRKYSDMPNKQWDSRPQGAEDLISKMRSGPQTPPQEERGPFKKGFVGGVGWGAFLLFCAVGGSVWWWGRKRRMEIESSRQKVTATGDAKIGGLWSLVDHEGRPVTSAEYQGKYLLMYFGFTYCPDICPAELHKMATALNNLSPEAQDLIVPMMVSVDPWRDSVAQLAGYVTEFHPRMIGLVGTPQQVDHMTRAFRVYTSKGPEESEGDYLMDHSIFMYLMDKDGKFMDYYGVAMEAEEITESIQNHLIARHDIAQPGPIGALRYWWNHQKDSKK